MGVDVTRREQIFQECWREAEEKGERRRVARAIQGTPFIPKETLHVPLMFAMKSGLESLRQQRPSPDQDHLARGEPAMIPDTAINAPAQPKRGRA